MGAVESQELTRVERVVDGREVVLETFKDRVSPGSARAILEGRTYPIIVGPDDVRTVLDVGANVGASSILFASHYPQATVHAFEPAPLTYELLARNVEPFDNVVPHHFGFHADPGERRLYRGKVGAGQASIDPSWHVSDVADTVRLEHLGDWLAAEGIGAIDVLKVDTEGCEVPIFETVGDRLADVKVVYFEAHSQADWRRLDAMLSPTHAIAVGTIFLETGEFAYVHGDVLAELAAKRSGSRPKA